MNLYCDNYSTCNEVIWSRGTPEQTRAVARAKGWHLFTGVNQNGDKWLEVVLGHKCVGGSRRDLGPAPSVLDGQLELF